MTLLGGENAVLGNSGPIHRHAHHMVYATDASGSNPANFWHMAKNKKIVISNCFSHQFPLYLLFKTLV
jgi:hypothetical protein